jgi:hypothetical protein
MRKPSGVAPGRLFSMGSRASLARKVAANPATVTGFFKSTGIAEFDKPISE